MRHSSGADAEVDEQVLTFSRGAGRLARLLSGPEETQATDAAFTMDVRQPDRALRPKARLLIRAPRLSAARSVRLSFSGSGRRGHGDQFFGSSMKNKLRNERKSIASQWTTTATKRQLREREERHAKGSCEDQATGAATATGCVLRVRTAERIVPSVRRSCALSPSYSAPATESLASLRRKAASAWAVRGNLSFARICSSRAREDSSNCFEMPIARSTIALQTEAKGSVLASVAPEQRTWRLTRRDRPSRRRADRRISAPSRRPEDVVL